MSDMRDLLLMVSMFMHVGTSVWSWLEKRNDKTNERLTDMQTKLETVERDVHGLKEAQRLAPSHADLGQVYEAIKLQAAENGKAMTDLSATVNQLVGENRGQSDTLRLILNQITQKGMK